MDPVDNVLQSLQNNVRQVEMLSQNIANANTPGYVGQQVFSLNNGENNAGVVGVHTLPTASSVKNTGRMLDIAMLNGGFLLVEKEGQSMLTRNGRLHINAEGMLTHSSGATVIGLNGPIQLSNGDIVINNAGEIIADGVAVDQLFTMIPQDPSSLQAHGRGLYQTSSDMDPLENNIQQGAINDASVQVSNDMVRMIELSRHTQSLQKAVQAIDQMANAGINELGKR